MPTSKKVPILKGKKSNNRVRALVRSGYEIKKVKLPNGDTLIMKRKLN